METAELTAAELASATDTTVESWGLYPATPVVVFRDGTVNADLGIEGVWYDIAAGNTALTERLVVWFAQADAE